MGWKRMRPPTRRPHGLKDVSPRDHEYNRYRNGQYGHLCHQVIGETALIVSLCSHDDLPRDVTHEALGMTCWSALTYIKEAKAIRWMRNESAAWLHARRRFTVADRPG